MAAPNRKVIHRSFAAVQIPVFMYNKTVVIKSNEQAMLRS